jgi:predicted PurR-regulated permease PerM
VLQNAQPDVRPRRFLSYLLVGALLYVVIQAFSLLSPILLSFLLIVLLSLAMNPVISRIRGLTGGRSAATGLVLGAFVLGIGLTAWVFYDPLQRSTTKIAERLPGYWERIQKPMIKMEKQAVLSEEKLQAEVTEEVAQEATATGEHQAARRARKSAPQETTAQSGFIRSSVGQMLQGVASSFQGLAFNAAQILVVFVTVFFGVFFTLMNPRPILVAIFSLVPERHHEQTLTILQRIGRFVPGWAMATLLGMLTVGLLVFLLMWPVFGFMDAMVLGLIAGILEAVPYIGPILSAVPAFLFAMGEGGLTPLWVVLAYLAVQALENNVISTIILAHGMKLHPVAVIFSMLLCVMIFGVLGVLVAAPMVAIVTILHDELYRKRFLPTVTDNDMDRMARSILHEKRAAKK